MLYHADFLFFFFNDTATTEIYTLSLHDALPILRPSSGTCSPSTITSPKSGRSRPLIIFRVTLFPTPEGPSSATVSRSEEHTSELQSRLHLVCRLLLEKKKNKQQYLTHVSKCVRQ